MLSDLLRSGLLKDKHNRYKSAGMLSDLLRSGLPNDESCSILLIPSESMLSDLLRSGLLKDRHDRYKSAGMLSDLMRSRLPNDYPHMNITNPVRITMTYWEYYPVTNLATYFIEIHVITLYFIQALNSLREFEIW